MRGLLVYPSSTPRKNNAFSWFREAAARYGIRLEVLFYDAPGVIPEGTPEWKPDFVLMRGYNIALSRMYEAQGIRVINSSESMILCRDKYRSTVALADAGVPVPRTFAPENQSWDGVFPDYGLVTEALGLRSASLSPFIMKLNFGSKGENVFLIGSCEQYQAAVETCRKEQERRLEGLSAGISEFGESEAEVLQGCMPVFQKYVASSRGRDLRVWVTGDEVAGHVLRYNEHSFKSNFASGGSYRQVPLPEQAAAVAVAAARAAGLFFAGVDLLFDGDGGFKVCEINGNAGFRTASADIPDALFRNLKKFMDEYGWC